MSNIKVEKNIVKNNFKRMINEQRQVLFLNYSTITVGKSWCRVMGNIKLYQSIVYIIISGSVKQRSENVFE